MVATTHEEGHQQYKDALQRREKLLEGCSEARKQSAEG